MRPSSRRRAARVAILCLGLAVAGCSGGKDADKGRGTHKRSADALAQVNNAELAEEDVRQLIPADYRESVTGAEIHAILKRWVETELLYQHALQEGLDRDAETAKTLQQMQRQILADEYLQRELRKRVRVSAQEVQDYYEKHSDEYNQEVHLRHIVVNSAEEARQVLAELRAGSDFRSLAQRYSVDPSGPRGGDLGFLAKGAMNPAFEPDVFRMAPGEVRGPIASGFGFHIVQVLARRPATEPLPFELARDEIMQVLLLEKQREAEQKLFAELRQSATVYIAKSYAGMPVAPESTPAPSSTVVDTTQSSGPDEPLEDVAPPPQQP